MSKSSVVLWIIGLVLAGAVVLAGCTSSGTASSGNSATGAKEKYVIGVDGAYPPYSYIDKDGNYQGFDVESAKWIAQKEGFDVSFQAIEWDGIIPALQAGKIDMVYSGMTITPERQEKVNFTNPYLAINQTIAIRNDSKVTIDDILAGKAIVGAQRGTTGAIWIENNLVNTGKMPKENLKEYDNFPLVITDLTNKNIDASIYDRPSHLDAIRGKEMHIIYEINTNETYGVAIRKTDPALLATMNKGIGDLQQDPHWQELLLKYNLS